MYTYSGEREQRVRVIRFINENKSSGWTSLNVNLHGWCHVPPEETPGGFKKRPKKDCKDIIAKGTSGKHYFRDEDSAVKFVLENKCNLTRFRDWNGKYKEW